MFKLIKVGDWRGSSMTVAMYIPSNAPIEEFEMLTQQIGDSSNNDFVLCIILQHSNIKNSYNFSWLLDTEVPTTVKQSGVKLLLPLTVSELFHQVNQTIGLMTQVMSKSWVSCDFVDILPFSHKSNSGASYYLEESTLEHLLSKIQFFVNNHTQLKNLATNLTIVDLTIKNIDQLEILNKALLVKASDLNIDSFILVPIENNNFCNKPFRALLNWTNKPIDSELNCVILR